MEESERILQRGDARAFRLDGSEVWCVMMGGGGGCAGGEEFTPHYSEPCGLSSISLGRLVWDISGLWVSPYHPGP